MRKQINKRKRIFKKNTYLSMGRYWWRSIWKCRVNIDIDVNQLYPHETHRLHSTKVYTYPKDTS